MFDQEYLTPSTSAGCGNGSANDVDRRHKKDVRHHNHQQQNGDDDDDSDDGELDLTGIDDAEIGNDVFLVPGYADI